MVNQSSASQEGLRLTTQMSTEVEYEETPNYCHFLFFPLLWTTLLGTTDPPWNTDDTCYQQEPRSEEVYLDLLPTSQSQDPTVGMTSGVHSRNHSNFVLNTVDVLR